MLWIILISVIGMSIITFLRGMNKDNEDLQGQTLSEKFSVMVDLINQEIFNGMGHIEEHGKRDFTLYAPGFPHTLYFLYGAGNLRIEWRAVLFGQKIVESREFHNLRNVTDKEQEQMALKLAQQFALRASQTQGDFFDNITSLYTDNDYEEEDNTDK